MHQTRAGLAVTATLLLALGGCINSSAREFPPDAEPVEDIDAAPPAPGTPDAPPVIGPDAGPLPTSASIRLIVEPNGNGGKEVTDAIYAAKTSVHMTMYLISSSKVQAALIDRATHGIDVKVVLTQNLPSGSNQSDFDDLTQAGVSVRWAPAQFTYTHEKTFIVDGKEAWIMSMNATFSAPTDNREYLAVDDDPVDVAEAEAIFAGDWAGTPPATVTGPLVVSPINSRAKLLALISTAQTSIAIEAEEFSDSMITAALVNAASAGISVKIVLSDETATTSQTNAVTKIKAAGGHLVQVSNPTIHAKSLVVDGKTAYIGSENFTFNSLSNNRELGVIFSVPSEVQKVVTTTAADFAKGTAL